MDELTADIGVAEATAADVSEAAAEPETVQEPELNDIPLPSEPENETRGADVAADYGGDSIPKAHDWMNTGHVYFVQHQLQEALFHYQKAHAMETNHTAFIEKFNKDKSVLLNLGLNKEDIQIMLDLLL